MDLFGQAAGAGISGVILALAALAYKWAEYKIAASRGEVDRRKSRSVNDALDETAPKYTSNASVIASNERLARHLHEVAELQRETSQVLSLMRQEMGHHGGRIEALHTRMDTLIRGQ